MRRLDAFTLLAAGLLLAISSQPLSAHEGHDHGTPAAAVALPATPRTEAASHAVELVAIARGGELIIYLDRFASNEPVPDATIALEIAQSSVEARPASDGTYRAAAPWAVRPGRYDLIATVTHGGTADVLALTLEIPPTPAPPSASGTGWAFGIKDHSSANDFGVVAALIVAFLAGAIGGLILAKRRRSVHLAVMAAGLGVLLLAHAAVAHAGVEQGNAAPVQPTVSRDVAQMLSDGSVFVPKSTQRILAIRTIITEPATYRRTVELPGRIIPDPHASGFVQAAVGGRLSPPDGGFPRLGTPVKRSDVLAYAMPPLQAIDVSDMRQRQGELDQQISIVERRLARYETLAPSGAVARSVLDETRLELQGLKDRRASLDKVRREPEALVAPVDGVIADGTPVAGQIAQPNAVIFHIIDPTRLWVEALSYEALPPLQRATARVGEKALTLAFRGAGFADRNQSIPIHFALEDDTAGVRVGQFVTVHAETPDQQRGLAVPRTSVVRTSSGQDSVYEHVAAERFEQRFVRIEPLDAQRVLISQGLAAGRRVVVQGAELIDHIR